MSDDGQHGLTLIAFVGSVFSPYYAWARRGGGKPEADQYCAINVALTGAGGHRWAMTERDKASMTRSAHELTVGPSRVLWNGRSLVAEIDEVASPFPQRLKGRITLHPSAITETTVGLDAEGRHFWSPIAPVARVEVRLEQPSLSWNGSAYLDSNGGTAPLEDAFKHWCWSRTIEQDRTRVLYDVLETGGTSTSLAVAFDKDGTARQIEAPPAVPLRSTKWRVPRATRAEQQQDARILQTWEDEPFYSRSLIETTIGEQRVMAVHESLSLDRFKRPIVQAMLPFRMPRRPHSPKT